MKNKNWIQSIYSGRLGRKQFLFGLLYIIVFIIVIGLVSSVILAALDMNSHSTINTVTATETGSSIALYLSIVVLFFLVGVSFYVLCLFPLLVRRLHDIGKSGWYSFLSLIPYVNILFVIFLLIAKGQNSTNMYGEVIPSSERSLKVIFGR